MANNFFKNLMDSPQPESPNPKEQVEQYDAGQTSVQTAEATLQPPTLIDQTVPSPAPEPQSTVDAGDDRKYGFIEQETFDQPDIMEGYQAPVGYDEMQAARNANLIFLVYQNIVVMLLKWLLSNLIYNPHKIILQWESCGEVCQQVLAHKYFQQRETL